MLSKELYKNFVLHVSQYFSHLFYSVFNSVILCSHNLQWINEAPDFNLILY